VSNFATEFSVSPAIGTTDFAALAIAWVRGINSSTVLEDGGAQVLEKDEAFAKSNTGETFSLKSVETSEGFVIGVRHEMPDPQGRIWRTENVLTNTGSAASLRVKGQCVALSNDVEVSVPKKPYFIKLALNDGWGESDGSFEVADKPIFLSPGCIEVASKIVTGTHDTNLPIIYVSAIGQNKWHIDVERLAFKLGGVAHVVVEPNEEFSRELNESACLRNPYGGTIAICLPTKGTVRKYYLGGHFPTERLLLEAVERGVISLSSRRSVHGAWDWLALQEQHARNLREKLKASNDTTIDEYVKVFDEDLEEKDRLIAELQIEVERLSQSHAEKSEIGDSVLSSGLINDLGVEIYEGEFSDRLRSAIKLLSEGNEVKNFNSRTQGVIKKFLEITQFTGRSVELIRRIKAASNDTTTMPKKLGRLLVDLGYEKTSDNKHLKYTPSKQLFGLGPEILPSSPSDVRAGKNRASDFIKNLGLNDLK
jgi:hypothetical protein